MRPGEFHQIPRFPTYEASSARSLKISRCIPALHWYCLAGRPAF
jgi:hypothetical protein